MQRILRSICPLIAVASVALIAGCGGDDGAEVSSGTDVKQLIDKTFAGKKDINSGKLDVKIDVNLKGAGAGIDGPIKVALSGPFESQGKSKLPKFDLAASFEGAGQSIKAGATSTGDKGFLSFQGTDYAVGADIFNQFKSAYEQAAKQAEGKSSDSGLQSLGIDPRRWLTNAKNAGETKVGDADTIKITGDVDISKLLDDVNSALSKAGSLGLGAAGADIPTKITAEQKAEVEKAIKKLNVEIYTGKDDTILRRMVIVFSAADPADSGGGSADVNVDFSLLDLNEGQDIAEPSDTKPLDQLLGQLGGLGGLLGGATGGGGSGSGGGSSGSSGGGSSGADLEEYTKCVQDAGGDIQKAQKCADLLTP